MRRRLSFVCWIDIKRTLQILGETIWGSVRLQNQEYIGFPTAIRAKRILIIRSMLNAFPAVGYCADAELADVDGAGGADFSNAIWQCAGLFDRFAVGTFNNAIAAMGL